MTYPSPPLSHGYREDVQLSTRSVRLITYQAANNSDGLYGNVCRHGARRPARIFLAIHSAAAICLRKLAAFKHLIVSLGQPRSLAQHRNTSMCPYEAAPVRAVSALWQRAQACSLDYRTIRT